MSVELGVEGGTGVCRVGDGVCWGGGGGGSVELGIGCGGGEWGWEGGGWNRRVHCFFALHENVSTACKVECQYSLNK